jgi:hypothetical protein
VYKQVVAVEDAAQGIVSAPPQQKKKTLMQGLFKKKSIQSA